MKLRLMPGGRIKSSWIHTEEPPVHWWDIPMVNARINEKLTADPATTYHISVAEKYLSDGHRHKGLSLGCGTGANEVRWAKTGRFGSIDAYDISETRIHAAEDSIRRTSFQDIIHYRAGDIMSLHYPPSEYDAVIFEGSLHHFSPLETLFQRIRDTLKPGGLVVANEFVGPTRFQWTNRQLEIVNELLDSFPHDCKTLWMSKHARMSARRPGKLAMWLSDPSEAVESSRIVPLFHQYFDVLEYKGYGGTILQLLFDGIAHHFVSPDADVLQLLHRAFSTEDACLESREINHDHALIVARRNETE